MQQLQYDIRPGEFADAVNTTRSARTFFAALLGLAILWQITAFALVQFAGVLDGDRPAAAGPKAVDAQAQPGAAVVAAGLAPAPVSAPAPKAAVPVRTGTKATTRPAGTSRPAAAVAAATAPTARAGSTAASHAPATPASPAGAAAAGAKPAPAVTAKRAAVTPPPPSGWENALQWSLPLTKFLALASALLVTIAIAMTVMLSLIGRLGGMAALIGAFFWSTILLAMVVPWQQALPGSSLACGALFNFAELTARRAAWGSPDAGWQALVFYYGRFLAYPLVAACVWVIVHVKFAQGCAQMHYPHVVAPVSGPADSAAPAGQSPRSASTASAARSPAQRAMDERTEPAAPAAPAAPVATSARPTGPLTERFLGPKAQTKPQEPGKEE